MLDSLVRVSRRANGSLSSASRGCSATMDSGEHHLLPRAAGGRDGVSNAALVPPASSMLTSAQSMPAGREAGVSLGAPAASVPFPLSNFKYFLTLFSKFFSSFPHGTCSLSVSRRYLALDGIYHPLWAALPSNSTLREPLVERQRHAPTGLSPS